MIRSFPKAALLAATSFAVLAVLPARAQVASGGIETVTVTAERRAEDITKVPESISAFQKDKMDELGIKDVSDLVKFTPGVSINPDTRDISIRGINSTAGSATTGVYIDDTPIQIRNLGFSSNSSLPAIFDLDRVEVLRGPQGTLFGAGSEGGTIRYITPQPSFTDSTVYARSELSFTENGAPSVEGGVAFGGPLSDTLAFRIAGWARQDGGFVDHVNYQTLGIQTSNANSIDSYTGRVAFAWQPNANLTITPSVFVEGRQQNDSDDYWLAISTPGHLRSSTPEPLEDNEGFFLPSVKADYQLDNKDLIVNVSYFNRQESVNGYSGTLYNLSYFQQSVDSDTDPDGLTCPGGLCAFYANNPALLQPLLQPNGLDLPGYGSNYVSVATITNRQSNFNAEARLQSNDSNAPFVWVIGAFFQSERQVSIEQINDPQLPALTQYLWGEDMLTAWGEDLLPNGDDYINDTVGRDTQVAGFGNATYAITDTLKIQAGVRVAWAHFAFINSADGPQNFGPSGGSGSENETPVTPMAGITWQFTPVDMLYATYSRGYRIGGANAPTPPSCDPDLADLGLATAPTEYKSDTVTNYEAGTKDSFLGHRLQVSASAFHLNWNNIQQSNYLPTCGIQYTANLGRAVSNGFDLQGDWLVTDQLELDGTVGYVAAHYTETAFAGPSPAMGIEPLTVKGEALPGAAWTFSAGAQYNMTVAGNTSYLRADYAFTGRSYGVGGGYAVGTASYDPALVPDPSYGQLSARAAMDVGNLNLALFANNLLNAHPQLDLNHQDQFTELFEAETLRPRTIGLTATYKL